MATFRPKLTIGLPVYNGERYLKDAIESHLAQDFTDYELLIADNASTDGTIDIINRYVTRDSRIRYHGSDVNHGATWNFNRLVGLASGQYFKWSAYDDVMAPTFLSTCVNALDSDPAAAGCFTGFNLIDADGNVTGSGLGKGTDQETPSQRFLAAMVDVPFQASFSIFHTDILKRTAMIASYANCDVVMLAEITLYGKLLQLPDQLFFSRDHEDNSVRSAPSPADRAKWFSTNPRNHIYFPICHETAEYFRAIRQAPLSMAERMRCRICVLKWMRWNASRLIRDVRRGLRDQREARRYTQAVVTS